VQSLGVISFDLVKFLLFIGAVLFSVQQLGVLFVLWSAGARRVLRQGSTTSAGAAPCVL
jgi:hypothetical protein